MIRTSSPTAGRKAALGLFTTLAAGLLLAGCSGISASSASEAGSGGGAPRANSGTTSADLAPAVGSPQVSGPIPAPSAGSKSYAPAALGLLDRSIIRTATLTVRVRNVLESATRAESLASGAGGFVAGEQTKADPDHPEGAVAVLTLRVPGARLPQLLGNLGRLGALLSEDQAANDVTGEVIDVQARIQSQQASVNRIRTLLGQARTIGQVVQIEGELANREGALESLKGQAKALADQTSLATVTATLVGPEAAAPLKKPVETGFKHGLSEGWKAFTSATTWLLTAVGAVLPFLILAVPLAWAAMTIWRRRGVQPVAVVAAPEPESA